VLLARPLADEGLLIGMVLEREDEVEIGGDGPAKTDQRRTSSLRTSDFELPT